MDRTLKEFASFAEVLFAIRAGVLVGGTENLEHGNQLPMQPIADLNSRDALHIDGRQANANGGFPDEESLCCGAGLLRGHHGHVPAPEEPPLSFRQLVDIELTVGLDDVIGIHLGGESVGETDYKLVVKIRPDI